MIFLSQNILGILGNFSLLYHYLFCHFTGYSLRFTDLIVERLLIANPLVMLSTGIPRTMGAFGWKHFLNNIERKVVYCIHREARYVSIGNICLLSVRQTINISPRNSRWAQLKMKVPKYVESSIFLCWILHTLINIIFTRITVLLNVGLLLFPGVSCLVLVIWSSGSMVFILPRHKQRVVYVDTTNISPRSSPESRATQSILVLVSTFVSLYTLSSVFHISFALFNNRSRWLVNSAALITACFPTVSPYILTSHDLRVSRLFFSCIKIK
ncbi:vomeronasal type-1 receptor 4-like [Delphinus delphis]|uniref:vomeronasal type-1 receptor 4-like n=1 Tax=Delphinus delphis TaxID=9728 RepID=UPI00375208C3